MFYGNTVLDLTKFAKTHPGSEKAVEDYKLQDVKETIFEIYPHSQSVIEVLQSHRIGHLNSEIGFLTLSSPAQ